MYCCEGKGKVISKRLAGTDWVPVLLVSKVYYGLHNKCAHHMVGKAIPNTHSSSCGVVFPSKETPPPHNPTHTYSSNPQVHVHTHTHIYTRNFQFVYLQ